MALPLIRSIKVALTDKARRTPPQDLPPDPDAPYAMETDDISPTNGIADEDSATETLPDTSAPVEMDSDRLLASDFDAMKEAVLTPLAEEPPILEDVVFTWPVHQWRSLHKKEHGPTFKAGGYPWYVCQNKVEKEERRRKKRGETKLRRSKTVCSQQRGS